MNIIRQDDSLLEKLVESVKELYVDIKSKYKFDNLESFKKNEMEKLKEINVFQLIDYIKESIDIYINYKLDEAKNSTNNTDDQQKVFQNCDEDVYEKMINKLEADIRNHIKVEYELKLQNEYLESKLEEYEGILSEMEKLQTKLDNYEAKFCSSEFMEMNIKENEIIILRAENSNLKNGISNLEKTLDNFQLNFSEYKTEKDKFLSKNQETINHLTKRLKKFEETCGIDNLQNSVSEKSIDHRSSQISQRNMKNMSMRPQSYRYNYGENILNLFNSDSKEKTTERKVSTNELLLLSDNYKSIELKDKDLISELLSNEAIIQKLDHNSATEKKIKKRDDSKFRAFSNIFEKINKQSKVQKVDIDKKKESLENNNLKRSSSANDFNPNDINKIKSKNKHKKNNIYNNQQPKSSNMNKLINYQLSKSDTKEQNEKSKLSIGYDVKSLHQNNLIASQTYFKNNLSINSENINYNLNKHANSNDTSKTPISMNSRSSIPNYSSNNNIIINNSKYGLENNKPITNLNMVFKFKTILNDEGKSKVNKIVKIDAHKLMRDSNPNKNMNSMHAQNEFSYTSGIKKENNNPTVIINNNFVEQNKSNCVDSLINTRAITTIEKKEMTINNYNSIHKASNTRRNNESESYNSKNQKVLNFNSTLRQGNSISKNKLKSASKFNENIETIKYSVNNLKDNINPSINNPKSKSKSKSKGKINPVGMLLSSGKISQS